MVKLANRSVRRTALKALLVGSSLLVSAATATLAQQVRTVPGTPATTNNELQSPPARNHDTPTEQEISAKSAQWHAECMRDWDQQTHMTKQEWFHACERTVDDRVQWLRGVSKQ